MNNFFRLLVFGIFLNLIAFCCAEESFVVIIPSYNNASYVEMNLKSIFEQKYDKFRIIYINDASADETLFKVKSLVKKYKFENKITLINNPERKGSLYNIYNAIINFTKPHEIVALVDGDDALADPDVLAYLNSIYSTKKVWFTFGQFIHLSDKHEGFCHEFPKEIIENNSFRSYQDMPSHLKTFYSWLFRKIKKEDLMYKGKFFSMTGDLAIVLPLIEMASYHHKFINRDLYLYNDQNPLNDHKVDQLMQTQLALYIRSLPQYKPLQLHEVPIFMKK